MSVSAADAGHGGRANTSALDRTRTAAVATPTRTSWCCLTRVDGAETGLHPRLKGGLEGRESAEASGSECWSSPRTAGELVKRSSTNYPPRSDAVPTRADVRLDPIEDANYSNVLYIQRDIIEL